MASPTAHSDARALFRALPVALADAGFDTVFGVMGEDTAALTVGIIEHGTRYLGSRHEAVAVGMADGYSWASGRIGLCMVTRGPGLMNAMTALRTAVQGRRRVLAIIGDVPLDADSTYDNKYIDQRPLADAIGLRFFTASSPDGAMSGFHDALASADSGHPAVLAIPVDLFHAEVSDPGARPASAATAPPVPPAPQAAEVGRLCDLLRGAARPLILAGAGATGEGVAELLGELAARSGALLGTSLLAKDLFRGHPNDLGVVGGFASDPAAPLLGGVDVVLAFGASLTPHTTGQRTLFRDATVVQIDRDPARIGVGFPAAVGVIADTGVTARALLDALGGDQAALPPPHELGGAGGRLYIGPDESSADGLDPRVVTATFDRILPDARTVVLDSGRFMTSPGRFLRVPGPGSFRLTAEAGSIGVGLGVALGAAVARPEAATVLFVGDGGMSQVVGDLETAARHSIPLIVVVMNDSTYGSEWVHLEADGLPPSYADLPTIDFTAVARSLGVEATTVRDLATLETLADALADRDAPLLIECPIRRDITATRLRWSS